VAEELVVGTVVAAAHPPGARAPALVLTVDLGPRGQRDAVLPTASYAPSDLEGTQVVCRLDDDGTAVVAGAESHAKGFVPLRPDDEVEPGTVVA
jgi:tRNA-binding EMAP/Myf-like protein